MKKIILTLCFIFIVYGIAFSQGHGTVSGLTVDQVTDETGWKRVGTTTFLDSPDYVIAIEDGGILTPSLAFRTDLNTGLFLQASDILSFVSGGAEVARLASIANGANCFLFTPSQAGAPPRIGVAGTDVNIDIIFDPKGNGIVEISSQIKITGGSPASGRVLTSDADGLAVWTLPSGGGFTDAGTIIILTNINDSLGVGESSPDSKFHVTDGGSAGTVTAIANTIATFESPGAGYLSILTPNANERGIFFGEPASQNAGGIIYNNSTTLDGLQFRTNGNNIRMVITSSGDVGVGTTSPNAELDIRGPGGQSVGGFPSGALHVTSTSALEFRNAVITGHNLFGGNTQLWYFGSTSSSNNNIALINRQNAELHFHTNDLNRFTIQAGGNVGIGATAPTVLLAIGNNNTGFTANVNDLDLITASGGVFKFVDNAFRAGLDASNYLEVGHGGSNSFINHVGAGNFDLRFTGVNKVTFTTAGHLHLMTDVDQKHTFKIITANNANDTGLAFENSGGSFTHTIFRTDVGSNRADLVFAAGLNTDIDLLTNSFKIHGEAADEGKLEIIGAFQISSGSPALDRVLTSDASGIATWTLPVKLQRIEGQFSGLITQVPATTTPIALTFEANDIPLQGISHSTTVDSSEFTANIAATYTWQLAPQWQKTTAAGSDTLDFFIQVDTGGGFATVANSNVAVISNEIESNVIFLSASIPMAVGDKIRFMFRSSNPPNLQTVTFPARGTIPVTPSQILNVFSGN